MNEAALLMTALGCDRFFSARPEKSGRIVIELLRIPVKGCNFALYSLSYLLTVSIS
ncbi:hypothetical protein FC43_GL000246 [Limosilactobacillus ingluviei DSM 15946]|uniref:Uncharacterized protein n=1 Tax=Limosilactobacillus ingluviei DSM 15946 TaxID=1423760 RepID=A0A0R1UAP9_9LACO|nr:hypothetical protein FC43_GL000246 [Limosilactobacillus ingluviei DSM 15946]